MLLSLLYVLLSGIALPVGGIQMQYLWRNQLGDVYSLGLGSAACLGAAAATMTGWCSLTLNVTGRNLLDCRYEMVRDYPMPGRSVLGGFTVKF